MLTAEARTVDRTGVEIEAMTACSVAALTVYDMVKGIERGVEIERVALLSKSGGRSGRVERDGYLRCAAAVITVSTSKAARRGRGRVAARGSRELLEAAGCEVMAVEVIPDERELIAGRLRYCADEEGVRPDRDHGRHGPSLDDVTPEATRDVIEREAPGIAEAMRLASREHVPDHWMLSRGVAGTRGRTLIMNFPAIRTRSSRRAPRSPSRSRTRSRCFVAATRGIDPVSAPGP